MKRFAVAFALFALSLPAPAGAKELVSLSLCGANGCHTTRDKHALDGAMDSIPQADPGQVSAFFRIRETIGEPGQPDVVGRVDSIWMPSIGVIRGEEGPTAGFTLPTPHTKRVLVALARGLTAFPVSKLPPATGVAGNARVVETVPAPPASTGSGAGISWAWALLAIPPLALLLWRRRHARQSPQMSRSSHPS
jgi:hypothetical protein